MIRTLLAPFALAMTVAPLGCDEASNVAVVLAAESPVAIEATIPAPVEDPTDPQDPHAGHNHGPIAVPPTVQNPATGPAPIIYADEATIDFGEILQGETREHTFKVGNRGDMDLLIRRVNPTCGCTVAKVHAPDGTVHDPKTALPNQDLLTLKPGEHCDITVEFNSAGQPTHRLEKTITVISTDNSNPALRLTMTMNVSKGITIDPNPLQFGDVVRGAQRTERAYAKLVKITDLEITGFQAQPDYLDVKWEKTKAPDGADAIAIDVTILPNAPIGYLTYALQAETNNDKMKTVPIHLYANIKSEVVFDTGNKVNQERVDFEVINAGESRTRTIEVTNGNPAVPYVISDLEVESKYNEQIKAELTEHEKGLRYTITLTTDPELTARFFRGILKIKSEHGDLVEKQIHFHGWVKKAE